MQLCDGEPMFGFFCRSSTYRYCELAGRPSKRCVGPSHSLSTLIMRERCLFKTLPTTRTMSPTAAMGCTASVALLDEEAGFRGLAEPVPT